MHAAFIYEKSGCSWSHVDSVWIKEKVLFYFTLLLEHFSALDFYVNCIKEIKVHPKMKIPSLFSVSNSFTSHWLQLYFWTIQLKSMGPKAVWLPTFFTKYFFVFHNRSKVKWVWNHMRVNKWRHTLHWVNYHFNVDIYFSMLWYSSIVHEYQSFGKLHHMSLI